MMFSYIARRLLTSILVLLAVSFVVYITFFTAVDPTLKICGRPCLPERAQQIREFMQTDRSAVQQWLDFLGGLFTGRTFGTGESAIHCNAPCFGFSFPYRQPVNTLIGQRLPITASVAIGGALLALFAGMGLGVLAARFRNRLPDKILRGFSLVTLSVPTYLMGLLVLLVFGFYLNMFPNSGYVPLTENPAQWAYHLVMPWSVIGALNAASYLRFARNQMLEELNGDHLLAYRAMGAPRRRVLRAARHGVWVPLITMFGLDFAGLLGGAVFTERVFSIPGLGTLLIDSVGARDLGAVVGISLFAAALVIFANLIVDIAHGLIDPRIRRG